jgi:prepilin-type N-terminal cleavage/methylation domain-containing protein
LSHSFRQTKNDKGFTLIELLVVILIIAILAAVGIVALLGAIRAGQDSAAKTTMNNAIKEIRTLDVDGENLQEITIADGVVMLNERSPDFTWQTTAISGDPTNVITVSRIGSANPESAYIKWAAYGARSKSGKCLYWGVRPLSSGNADNGGIPKSTIKIISKKSHDSCPLVPTINEAGNGGDEELYDTY